MGSRKVNRTNIFEAMEFFLSNCQELDVLVSNSTVLCIRLWYRLQKWNSSHPILQLDSTDRNWNGVKRFEDLLDKRYLRLIIWILLPSICPSQAKNSQSIMGTKEQVRVIWFFRTSQRIAIELVCKVIETETSWRKEPKPVSVLTKCLIVRSSSLLLFSAIGGLEGHNQSK